MNAGERQLVIGAEDLVSIGSEDLGRRLAVIQDHDDGDARVQVFGHLGEHAGPAVALRADLDDQLGHLRPVGWRERTSRQALIIVKGEVRSPEGVRAPFGDDARIIAEDVAQVVFLGEIPEVPDDLGADLAMASIGSGTGTILPRTSSSGWPGSIRRANSSAVVKVVGEAGAVDIVTASGVVPRIDFRGFPLSRPTDG